MSTDDDFVYGLSDDLMASIEHQERIDALGVEIKAALAGVSRAMDDPDFGTADMELAKTLISKRMGLRVLAGLRPVTLPRRTRNESALLAA